MTKLDNLVALLKKAPDEVFIQPHNVPDPDAIAASFGLQKLLEIKGIETQIVYENEIEKANSSKMLELFGIQLSLSSEVDTLEKKTGQFLWMFRRGIQMLQI
jgi:nanoRNase/pAp phosphatase (c-di-AMP/oligoRNAs hydrolase)